MLFPTQTSFVFRFLLAVSSAALAIGATACAGPVVQKTEAEAIRKEAPPTSVPLWMGSLTRDFYGTGPWPDRPVDVIWEVETKLISGRLHKDGWGGTSWPGQPSVAGDRVYFGSADGNLYCLDKRDGTLIWRFKTEDSLKATPTIAGDKIIASGLDHYVYCLNAADGPLIWKYKTGFEIDCSAG